MSDLRILDAFRLMWGPFPEPALLIQKDRTVLAVNDLAAQMGIPVGVKCHSLNPEVGPNDDHCRRCRADAALRTGKTVCVEETMGSTPIRGYWMPLSEAPGLYVHFGIGTAEAMAKQQGCRS